MKQITMDYQTYTDEIAEAERRSEADVVRCISRLARLKKIGTNEEELRLLAYDNFQENADAVLTALGIKTWKECKPESEPESEARNET